MCLLHSHMHKMGVVHRDIKPENIMLRYSIPEGLETSAPRPNKQPAPFSRPACLDERLVAITLVDFGFAADCAVGEEALTDACGTPDYVAPEVVTAAAVGETVKATPWHVTLRPAESGTKTHPPPSVHRAPCEAALVPSRPRDPAPPPPSLLHSLRTVDATVFI